MNANSQQPPLEEMAERIAEAAPVKLAGAAVGLESHRRILHDHARRVHDSHRLDMLALGLKEEDLAKPEDEMGNITISGDHHHTYTVPLLEKTQEKPATPTLPAPQQPVASSGIGNGLKAALVAAAIGGPLAGGLTGWMMSGNDTTTEVVRTLPLEDRILDVWSEGGQVRQRVRLPNEKPSWEK